MYSKLEAMMINILSEGKAQIWKNIEEESNAFVRFNMRDLYFKALEKLSKTK